MEQRLKYLMDKNTISKEDAKVLLYISKGQLDDAISLLDLTLLLGRLKMYLRETTNVNRKKLYLGLIGLVNKFIEEWGTKNDKPYSII